MYLKELVINGFKSFAERTRIQLDQGITCIVGPNGCGKSNIVDAVRWVLGEQSAKALRGSKMHDVIFQGTDRRKPLPSCEVSLVFTDCEAELGTAFNEVEITRKVDREGGGDYFLNGKRCRLKDIQRLFMDTGVGQASYSFMMQGQIDQILSSNPQERRSIFEEAAGITKYKEQRKETLNRLNLVEQNLSRVTDVLEEKTKSMRSLERQAKKALRYKRLKHRLTHLELAWQAHEFHRRHATIQELSTSAENFRRLVTTGEAKLTEENAALDRRREQRNEMTTELDAQQQKVFDLQLEQKSAENQANFAEEQKKSAEERVESAEKEIEQLEKVIESAESSIKSAEKTLQEAEAALQGSDASFQAKNKDLSAFAGEVSKVEAALQTARQDLLVKEGSVTRLRQQATSSEVDLRSFEMKQTDLKEARAGLEQQVSAAEKTVADVESRREACEAETKAANEAIAAAHDDVRALREKAKARRAEIAEADRDLARQSARLNTLENLQKRFEGFSEGAKAILQGKFAEALDGQEPRPLPSLIEIDDAHSAALETLLGSSAEAIALPDSQRVPAVVSALKGQKAGQAVLQVPAPGGANGNAPEGLTAAFRAVSVKDQSFAPLVESFFAGCYLAESLESFLAMWREHPDFAFAFVATADGALIDRRGLIYGGREPSGAGESFLRREGEIKRLRQAVDAAQETLTTLHEGAMALESEIEAAEKVVEEKRARATQLGQELSGLRSEAKAAEKTLADQRVQLSRNESLLSKLAEDQQAARERLEKASAQLQDADAAIVAGRRTVGELEEKLIQLRAERDGRKDAMAELRLEVAEKKQRVDFARRAVSDAQSEQRQAEQRLRQRRQEIDELTAQIDDLAQSTSDQRDRAGELNRTLETTQATLAQTRRKVQELDEQIRAAEQHLNQQRLTQKDHETKLSSLEIKLSEERAQANFIVEKVRGDYECEIAECDWKRELWRADEEFETRVKLAELEDDEELRPKAKPRGEPSEEDLTALEQTDWAAVKQEVSELKSRINSLGAINLIAIEEYTEQKESYEFLKQQSDDLWASKTQLVRGLDELNEISQRLFAETFEQVRKNFIHTFDKLFAGGEADLQLIQGEDILDSGIDIIARPPGTRLRNLTLLSGGQRTMTAVALLFAIYLVKPSPFAVLDELDAPLDDANIGRFCDIVKEFTQYSQFLIVTHNKRTVAAADSIYGVTMQERGVTKLISMRFQQYLGDEANADVAAGADGLP